MSFVTGKGGRFLRMVEEEFGTLLFFLGCPRREDAQRTGMGLGARLGRSVLGTRSVLFVW